MRDDFAVMICSHGRAETLTTYDALKKCGYSGKIIIVIDDEDEQQNAYNERFDHVEVFCKEDYFREADGVIEGKQKAILYARNACYDIAEKNGLSYFAELDDDITGFDFRYIENGKARSSKAVCLDEIFETLLSLFNHERVKVIGIMNQGAYIGGVNAKAFKEGVKRSVSNLFLLDTKRRVNFIASMNEDTCSALVYGQRGDLFLALNGVMQSSEPIGGNTTGNGMCDFYRKLTPFARTFIAVVVRPDCVLAEPAKDTFRIRISWKNAVPYIINARWKK